MGAFYIDPQPLWKKPALQVGAAGLLASFAIAASWAPAADVPPVAPQDIAQSPEMSATPSAQTPVTAADPAPQVQTETAPHDSETIRWRKHQVHRLQAQLKTAQPGWDRMKVLNNMCLLINGNEDLFPSMSGKRKCQETANEARRLILRLQEAAGDSSNPFETCMRLRQQIYAFRTIALRDKIQTGAELGISPDDLSDQLSAITSGNSDDLKRAVHEAYVKADAEINAVIAAHGQFTPSQLDRYYFIDLLSSEPDSSGRNKITLNTKATDHNESLEESQPSATPTPSGP
jgi:hypothetical protein